MLFRFVFNVYEAKIVKIFIVSTLIVNIFTKILAMTY